MIWTRSGVPRKTIYVELGGEAQYPGAGDLQERQGEPEGYPYDFRQQRQG